MSVTLLFVHQKLWHIKKKAPPSFHWRGFQKAQRLQPLDFNSDKRNPSMSKPSLPAFRESVITPGNVASTSNEGKSSLALTVADELITVSAGAVTCAEIAALFRAIRVGSTGEHNADIFALCCIGEEIASIRSDMLEGAKERLEAAIAEDAPFANMAAESTL